MADLDRGAYAPPTDTSPLAFDARQPRRRRPLPITLILSVLILLGLIAAMVFIYRQGVRGEGDEPQPVGEPVGAVREPPPAEAQPIDPASGLDVYTDEGEAAGPQAPVFTAPPEQPIARPAPAPALPAVTGTTGAGTAPARAASAPAPTPRPASPPQARPAPTPTTPPATRPTAVSPPPTADADRVPEAVAPRPAPTVPPTAAAVGRVSAQIGAFNTRAQAQAALAARPGGAGQRIEEVQRNGTTLYRAIVTGFPDRAAAQAYCSGVPGGCVIR